MIEEDNSRISYDGLKTIKTIDYDSTLNLRNKYKGHPFYNDTIKFCETYDQNSFDPVYNTIKLEEFIPMVHRIFDREPHKHVYLGL